MTIEFCVDASLFKCSFYDACVNLKHTDYDKNLVKNSVFC